MTFETRAPLGTTGAHRPAVIVSPLPRGDSSTLTVLTVMSHPVLAVTASTQLPDALHAMIAHGLRHLAVIDSDGRYVGLLTDRTVAAEWAARPLAYPHRAVGAACEDRQPVVAREATVAAAAQEMRRCGTDAVVVVDRDRRPVGILTGGDLIALLAKPDRAEQRGSP